MNIILPPGGAFRLSCKVFAVIVALAAASRPASAQNQPAPTTSNDQILMLDPVITTGTRFTNRTVLESVVPIDVINASDLRMTGLVDIGNMLAASVPSITYNPNASGSDASFARPIHLRGLNSDAVLILVNGKRLHPSSWKAETPIIGADIEAIAPNAFSSVEVLRDGAAAQYGSDAISGVINFNLKRVVESTTSVLLGETMAGDGGSLEITADEGQALGTDGFIHTSFYYHHHDFTNRQGYDVRQQYFAFNSAGQPVILPVVSSFNSTPVLPPGDTFDPREATFDRKTNYLHGDPDSDFRSIFINAEKGVGHGMTFYFFGGLTEREEKVPYVFRQPLNINNVRGIFPNGFEPIEEPTVTDIEFTAGIKGKAAGWDWDFSETLGQNEVFVHMIHSLNPSMGLSSPTSFYAGKVGALQSTFDLDVTKQLFPSLGVAGGLEYRDEGYWIGAGDPTSYNYYGVLVLDGPQIGLQTNAGSQAYPGFRPSDSLHKNRTNEAGYVDFDYKVTPEWDVDIAGRAEKYSDAGNTEDGKVAMRYQITPNFALRGSISNGFRAPSLLESYYSQTPTIFVGSTSYITRSFPVTDPIAVLMGAKPLKPEHSTNASVGVTGEFLNKSLNITLDAYQILVTQMIIRSSLFNDASSIAFLQSHGYPNVAGAEFFINAVDERTRGFDITAHYALPKFANGGRITLTAALNVNQPLVTWVAPTPPQLAAITSIALFTPANVLSQEYSLARQNSDYSLDYNYKRFEANIHETRYGSIFSVNTSNAALNQTFGAKWITDISASFKYSKMVTFTVGVNNLFNTYPDQVIPQNNNTGTGPYPNSSPFGIDGGFFFAKATVNFK